MKKKKSLILLESQAANSYDQIAEAYDDPSHETVRNFEMVSLKFLETEVLPRVVTNTIVLDLGGGRGYVAAKLEKQGCKCILGDISKQMLICSQKKRGKKITYIQMSAFRVPIKKNSIDIVTTFLCGAYMRKEALEEIFRVLSPGGLHVLTETPTEWVLATQPQRGMPSGWTWFKDQTGKVVHLPFQYVYSLDEICNLVESVGFEVLIRKTLTPRGSIPVNQISKVNRNAARVMKIDPQDIPLLSAVISRKPIRGN